MLTRQEGVCCCPKKCVKDKRCRNNRHCYGGKCVDEKKECPKISFLGEDGDLQSFLPNGILPNSIQSMQMNEENPLNALEDKRVKKRCCCTS